MIYKLNNATMFEDWDIANRQPIHKSFPAGTRVRDVLRPGNQNCVRLVAVVGVDGFIASVVRQQITRID